MAGVIPYDTELRTPVINAQNMRDIYLSFKANYQNFAGYDTFDVDISVDNGATWTNILR